MKLVIGIVRPERANRVLEALYRADVRGFSMSRVQGHGGEVDHVETYRGTTVKMELSEKVRFEIAVSDGYVDTAVEAIREGAYTGEVGDGKIFVVALERVVRIRTGEVDTAAVTPVALTPLAASAAGIDSGDTAWLIVATALVLLMTPALGLFYAGLVRSKNALNTLMMSVAALGVVGVSWALVGYSLAFDRGNGFIGGFHHALLRGIGFGPQPGTAVPQLLYFAFQASFCIITAALISGAVVERMSFGTYLVFAALWSCLVYAPLAHWLWGGGWLAGHGVLDFAGGIPVEMASGFSAFAAAMVVGARKDFGRIAILPHNSVLTLLGASLLWFGWFGFNSGSALSTGNSAILAFVNTLLAPASTLVVWIVLDLARGRRATAIGAATAIIVGAVGITPAAGYVSPLAAMLLGAVAALPSYGFILWRPRIRLDETLDVLAAHGLAGLTGMLFVGFFAERSWNGVADGLVFGAPVQLARQALAVATVPAYAFGATFVLLRLIGLVLPLRVTRRDEGIGLDVTQHGEEAYTQGDGALLLQPE